MLLKDDVMNTMQKWGSMPRHAGLEMDLFPDRPFFTRMIYAAPDSKKNDRTWCLHVYILAETAVHEMMAYRSGNHDRLPMKRNFHPIKA